MWMRRGPRSKPASAPAVLTPTGQRPSGAGASGAPAAGLWSWEAAWLDSAARRRARLWRAVEAQHVVSTLRLVDTVAEQATLEDMLEASKPPLPPDATAGPYLLTTPFRYVSAWPSRFRAAHRPGVWYGAEHVRTALAEVGYWRWRVLMDSAAFDGEALLAQFTVFQAQVSGRCVDVGDEPWRRDEALWRHPHDYTACQALAEHCAARSIAWIRYGSVRDPRAGACGAVLSPAALSLPTVPRQQLWVVRVTAGAVLCSPEPTIDQGRVTGSVEFDATRWR